jgi:nitronate monooxygenase
LLAAPAEATVLTEAFSVGWPDATHRVLRSAVAAAQALPDEVVAMWQTGKELRPIPRWFAYLPSREITGYVEAMAMYAGQGVGQVTQVVPAAQVVTELADGADELLRRWGPVEAPDSPEVQTLR